MIPSEANVDIQESSFFKHHKQLPSPESVRSEALAQHLAGVKTDKRKTLNIDGHNWKPPPVLFDSLKLFVKWGGSVKIAEAQSLYALRRYVGAVPVPEIFGWRTDGGEIFIYMEAIEGRTLEQAWDTIGVDDRVSICRELRAIFDSLRMLKQDPSDQFVGTVARGLLYDRSISSKYLSEMGPFASVERFHAWFTTLFLRPVPDPESIPEPPFRRFLSDNSSTKFTQGDLHRSNIMVSLTSPVKVMAIVDWEQAGWLPDYWESCKAHLTAYVVGDWPEKYLPMIIDEHPDALDSWNWYTMALGP